LVRFPTCGVVALDLFSQRIKNARHGDDDGDSLAFDRFHDLRWAQRLLKENLATEQLRHKDAHELSEDMAEWQ
jgi:hypothetical protein